MATTYDTHINHEYKRGFLQQVENAVDGKTVVINNAIQRMQQTFNLQQSQFALLGSVSGVGKSSLIDDLFLLKPWASLQMNPDRDIHFEAMYYSMERKKLFKHAKWMSWLLYQEKGLLIPAMALMGRDPLRKPNKALYGIIREYDNRISDILDSFPIYDGRISAADMAKQIKTKAKQFGKLFISDSVGVRVSGANDYIQTFDPERVRQTRRGPVQYCTFRHDGEEHIIEPNQKEYFLYNPKTFLSIVLDGVGLIQTRKGQSVKQAIDEVTNLLADTRDVYGFSPIMVSQFNRNIADIQRQKHHGADLSPQEGDFKDSSNMFQAADLVLGLFDPYRMKAYNKQGMYMGYDITNGMLAPKGFSRFRSLHVLKNTFGIDGGVYGMGFWGEVNHFEVLPQPTSGDLQQVYARIASGK
jgi:hypothetical protein